MEPTVIHADSIRDAVRRCFHPRCQVVAVICARLRWEKLVGQPDGFKLAEAVGLGQSRARKQPRSRAITAFCLGNRRPVSPMVRTQFFRRPWKFYGDHAALLPSRYCLLTSISNSSRAAAPRRFPTKSRYGLRFSKGHARICLASHCRLCSSVSLYPFISRTPYPSPEPELDRPRLSWRGLHMNRHRSMTRQPFRSQGANFAALAPVSDLSHSRSLFLRRCR
ncbi:Uncharacterised protein [Achromobacter xylosoxidans]|nr:Uncharacterised protein [Achromobacter xylosoxidans]